MRNYFREWVDAPIDGGLRNKYAQVGDYVSARSKMDFEEDETVVAKPLNELTTQEYNAMLLGLAHGVLQQEGLTEVQTCIQDGTSEGKQVIKGFESLLHHDWVTGVKELGVAVEGLPHLLTDCRNISDDITTLKGWATVFEAPSALPNLVKSNVSHHILALTRDLQKARKEWKNEEYYAFGTTVGEALVIVTQPLK